MIEVLIALFVAAAALLAAQLHTLTVHGDLLAIFWWLIPVPMLATAYFSGRALHSFSSAAASITTPEEMAVFKQFVARQMYFALVNLVLLISWAVLIVVRYRSSSWAEFAYLLSVGGACSVTALWLRPAQRRCTSLLVPNNELHAEYERVCAAWRSRPLPSW